MVKRRSVAAKPRLGSSVRKSKPVKRTKTFTGCWTCRSRGVKCDEGKPGCHRCEKAGWDCEGYGIRLVWLNENGSGSVASHVGASHQTGDVKTKVVQRRLFFMSKNSMPVLSEEEMDSMLDTLDSSAPSSSQIAGPFGVFGPGAGTSDHISGNSGVKGVERISMESDENVEKMPPRLTMMKSYRSPVQPIDEASTGIYASGGVETFPLLFDLSLFELSLPSSEVDSMANERMDITGSANLIFKRKGAISSNSLKNPANPVCARFISDLTREGYRIPSSLDLSCFSLRSEERELMHYWISSLSRTMAPMNDINNPYRSIFIRLALGDSGYEHSAKGQSALRHSIYAIAAFNLAQRGVDTEKYQVIGLKHHQMGIRYLNNGLLAQNSLQVDFLLATIIVMFTIELINARSGWRIHLQGGRNWLQAAAKGLFQTRGHRGRDEATLYQMFLFSEALGFSHPTTEVSSNVNAIENTSDYIQDKVFGLTAISSSDDFRLDSIFGITRPIFESIVHINRLASSQKVISTTELEAVHIKIVLNSPLAYDFSQLTSDETITKHHAFIWYYACETYFEHTLRHTPSSKLQGLIKKSLVHLKAIEEHELQSGGYGLLWPRFVIACEAEGEYLRWAVSDYFRKGKDLGIANLTSAYTIVREVWRRRDDDAERNGMGCVSWRQVAADLNDDVLLL